MIQLCSQLSDRIAVRQGKGLQHGSALPELFRRERPQRDL